MIPTRFDRMAYITICYKQESSPRVRCSDIEVGKGRRGRVCQISVSICFCVRFVSGEVNDCARLMPGEGAQKICSPRFGARKNGAERPFRHHPRRGPGRAPRLNALSGENKLISPDLFLTISSFEAPFSHVTSFWQLERDTWMNCRSGLLALPSSNPHV